MSSGPFLHESLHYPNSAPSGVAERMHVIARPIIWAFAERHLDSASALEEWYRTIKHGHFANFPEIRAVYPSCDLISGNVFVFNIAGNKVRLVAAIRFASQTLYILDILTHAEYDKDKWK